jgi:hypothetical protein
MESAFYWLRHGLSSGFVSRHHGQPVHLGLRREQRHGDWVRVRE